MTVTELEIANRRAREPRCDRPVALFGDAEESAAAGKQPIVVDDGRRARRGKKARKRTRARIGRTEHGCWQVERAGNDQSQVHGKRGFQSRGTWLQSPRGNRMEWEKAAFSEQRQVKGNRSTRWLRRRSTEASSSASSL